jgi:hypothetical protein
MKKAVKLSLVFLVLFGILSSCRTHKDCGGRRKKKVKTSMGGYM